MGKRKVLLAGAVAGVLVAAGAVALMVEGGEDGPQPLEERWASEPALQAREAEESLATWVVDDAVVVVTERGGWAFETATGEQRWAMTDDESQLSPCVVSPEPNAAGLVAIVFEPAGGGPCDVVGAVDTRTGALLWSRRLPEPLGPTAGREIPVATGDEVITVDVRQAGSHHRFSPEGAEMPLLDPPSEGCQERLEWVQSAEYTLARCGDTLTAFATGSGEELWTERAGPRPVEAIVPGAPLMVIGTHSVTSLGDNGEVTGEASFKDPVDGIPLLLGESRLVSPVRWSPGLNLGGADLAHSPSPSWRQEFGDGVLAGAGDDHVLVVAPADEGDAEQVLLRVNTEDGERTEVGGFSSATVLAAAVDGDTLYAITAGEDPAERGKARVIAFDRPAAPANTALAAWQQAANADQRQVNWHSDDPPVPLPRASHLAHQEKSDTPIP
ncbi:PQQ-binding-like beta-propeller repeat protein [Streptomyces sedi]|uniref:Pyrrolo-quinoline quinone repeat domain-containing protein n=1 Tax=Streptomyces sedi TaxID=555059 RepID=A0A5C4VB19_9ACTN|nr:PQQ-binding-like beta-propeller repeat protein [Streptomyces sedi]TNM32676.1 hypothetical protein FH715_04905 [Streptomyces sedi]